MKKLFELLLAGVLGAAILIGAFIYSAERDIETRTDQTSQVAAPPPAPPVSSHDEAVAPRQTMAPLDWLRELLAIETAARGFRKLSEDERSVLALRAAQELGAHQSWAPEPRPEFAHLYCANAAQGLYNHILSLREGKASSAKQDLAAYREYKPKCMKALKG